MGAFGSNVDRIELAINLLNNSCLSNYAISRDTHISQSTLGNYKNGKTKPTSANAEILIRYFESKNNNDNNKHSLDAWERVMYIIDNEGYNKNSFSSEIGMNNNTTIGRLINEHRIPSKATIDKILTRFPKYNRDWLITGKGDPITKEQIVEVAPFIPSNIINVPLVGQYAYAGYLCGYADAEYIETLPTVPFIVDSEPHGHYIAFEVKGDSMNDGTEESYLEGDRLLCREIKPELWVDSKLHFRKWDFVIVHKEGILVKRIIDHNVQEATITIHSLNNLYEDRVLSLSDVRQIFNVIEMSRPRRR